MVNWTLVLLDAKELVYHEVLNPAKHEVAEGTALRGDFVSNFFFWLVLRNSFTL